MWNGERTNNKTVTKYEIIQQSCDIYGDLLAIKCSCK